MFGHRRSADRGERDEPPAATPLIPRGTSKGAPAGSRAVDSVSSSRSPYLGLDDVVVNSPVASVSPRSATQPSLPQFSLVSLVDSEGAHLNQSATYFRQPATKDLYGPLEWHECPLALRIALGIILVPFIGGFWVHFAVAEHKAGRSIGYNRGDAAVIFTSGLLHLISSLLLAVSLLDYNGLTAFVADTAGAGAFFTLSVVYFFIIAAVFKYKRIVAKSQETELTLLRDKDQENFALRVEETRSELKVESWVLIPVGALVGALMTFVIRLCVVDSCPDNSWNLLLSSEFYQSWSNVTMTVFWFLLSSAVTVTAGFGILLYHQQKCELESFATDEVTVWITYFESCLRSLRSWPLANAFVGSNAIFASAALVLSLFVLVLQNVAKLHRLADGEVAKPAAGSIASAVMLAYSVVVLFALIKITADIHRGIELRVRSISSLWHDVQHQLDAEADNGDGGIERLRKTSLSQVLWDLDTYLQNSTETTPRLTILSLDSIRWIGITGGLAALNVFFLALYIRICDANDELPTPAPS